jgi:hypothetical protein
MTPMPKRPSAGVVGASLGARALGGTWPRAFWGMTRDYEATDPTFDAPSSQPGVQTVAGG